VIKKLTVLMKNKKIDPVRFEILIFEILKKIKKLVELRRIVVKTSRE
jgi:hypothetical protein